MQRLTLKSPLGTAFRMFAFSTLLCAMTCYRAISINWTRPDPAMNFYKAYTVSLESGSLRTAQTITYLHYAIPTTPPAQAAGQRISIHIPEPLGYHDGILTAMFTVHRDNYFSKGMAVSRLIIPIWPLTLLSLIPALRFARHKYHERITRRRMRRGLCIECGYDLRASPGRCPECGAEREVETPAISTKLAA